MKTLTEQDIAPLYDEAVQRVFDSRSTATWERINVTFRRAHLLLANAILSTFGGVSEQEARERERTAFAGGAAAQQRDDLTSWQHARDVLYPSLAPTPRTVDLSNGTRWGHIREGWVCYDKISGQPTRYGVPDCSAIPDFEACAALLREEQRR